MEELNKRTICPACGNGLDNVFFTGSERMFGLGGEFPYGECARCTAVFIREVPIDLGSYYSGNYYSFREFRQSGTVGRMLKKMRYKAYQRGISLKDPVYFRWLSLLRGKPSDRIADIGCGNGQLLGELSYCGFQTLHGYDPFLDSSRDYSGFSLRKTDYFDIEERYDILMFHHSLEHLADPAAVFGMLEKILNPGGRVLIRVPVTDGQVWKEEREYWFQLDAPRHLFIPSTKSIQLMADRFGLELYESEFDSLDNQFWGTELYKRGKPFAGTDIKKEFTSKELNSFGDKAKLYNQKQQGDQACFYLRKR
ncbi:class I SAM-dependent methyltransferase [Algoriphagus jejuensis]